MTTPEQRTPAGMRMKYVAAAAVSLASLVCFHAPRMAAAEEDPPRMQPVRISDDGQRFVLAESGGEFVPWGFNYLGEFGELVEESWDEDWPRIERDFRQMRKLGGNVVRIHLQFGTYMNGPDEFDQAQLDRLTRLLDAAREAGLYLDITGLGCYRLERIPDWYDALDEAERWDVQARWWKKIAETCAGHPAVFCYDLMNEPIISGPAEEGEPRWVGGELEDLYFVQRISESPRGRTRIEIAEAWAAKLTTAIRQQDTQTPITAGVIPWAHVWPNAKPLFYSPEVSKHFDFVSIHVYPGHEEVDRAIDALAVYDIGKPLVVEETFPLNCSLEEMDRFVDGGRDRVDGWISHYFGHTIEEHAAGAEPVGTGPDSPFQVTVADFLGYWRDKGKLIAGTSPEAPEPETRRQPELDSTSAGSMPDHPGARFYSSQKLDPTRGYIETRDGTLLSYRVVLPDPDVHGPGPYDLVITYSGYQPSLETDDAHQSKPFEQFGELGYAVAGVNMRGTGCSGGAFDFMERRTWLDGYDMVEAFAAQPWVDDVALGDQSWPGLTQLFVASTGPPSLDAIVAGSVVGDFYRDVFYPGGIPNVGFGHLWASGRDAENAWPSTREEVNARVNSDPICAANQSLRDQNVNLLKTIKKHRYDDDFWRSRSAEVAKITVPTLQIVSWQDPQVGSRAATLSDRFPTDTAVRLVGVNGFHQYWSGAVWNEIVEFLDVYLGDAGPERIAEYESRDDFLVLLESDATGSVRGRFTLPSFAAAGNGQRMVLGADLTPDQDGRSGTSSTFSYDPDPPGSWTDPVQDQVTFTSDALSRQSVMAGSGSVDLWVAAGANDVDLQATVSEVRADGQEMLVQSGWLRASHRALDEDASTALRPRHLHTPESVEKLRAGQWTRLRIELFPFAHVFREGSRIRLTVSGPGGGSNAWPWAFDTLPGGFEVRIAHGDQPHSSSVVLPVVEPNDVSVPASRPECGRVWLQPCRPAETATGTADPGPADPGPADPGPVSRPRCGKDS